jgi:RNA-directed DNA polymerase
MSGDVHVRFCERPGVRFPRATHRVILVDGYRQWRWLAEAAYRRLLEELATLGVQVNQEKTRMVDLSRGESFGFLGFDLRSVKTLRGRWGVRITPKCSGP